MAQNTEEYIDLAIRVIPDHSTINITVPRKRSTDVIRDNIAFQANAHLWRILGASPQPLVKPSSIIGFEPTGKSKPGISTI